MPDRSLALSISSFSLTITEFLADGYDLAFSESGDVEYGLSGSVVDGTAFEPKRIWTIKAPMTREQWRLLQLIFQKSERIRRDPPNDFSIRVYDYVQPYVEDRTSRTRALAPGGSVTTITGGLEYPAQFNARMFQPKAIEWGNRQTPYSASFVLKELDRVSP